MKFAETLQDLSEIIRSTIQNRINQPYRLVSIGFAFSRECFYNLWLFYQHQQQNNSIFLPQIYPRSIGTVRFVYDPPL